MHVMIDLETFGTGPTAAIIQIGAQAFTFEDGLVPGRDFEATISLQSALLTGGTIDPSTVEWWKTQPPHTQRQVGSYANTLVDELIKLTEWFPLDEVVEGVWSHGAAFDLPILDGAYRRLGSEAPWHYRKARDTRTLLWLAYEKGWEGADKPKPPHMALADCCVQIFELRRAWEFLNTYWQPKEDHL
jgi:hypothetical protein